MALGRDEPKAATEEEAALATNAYEFRWAGLAPVAGAVTTVALALVLLIEGRRLERVQAYRLLAASLQGKTDAADRDRQLALRQAAANLAPESGRVLAELGQAHLDRFEERQAQWTARPGGRGGGPAGLDRGGLVGGAVAGRLGPTGRRFWRRRPGTRRRPTNNSSWRSSNSSRRCKPISRHATSAP